MSALAIAWRNLTTRPVQTALTTIIIALGVGLAIMAIVLAGGLRRGLVEAGGPFQIVVGPKGSATQLVVSSILLQDVPIGNLSYEQYRAVRDDRRADAVVPIALGDNVAGLRLVGTSPTFFQVTVGPDDPPFYRVAEGRAFTADFEAVLGSAAAQRLGLGVGGEVVSGHGALGGVNEAAHANRPYRVVGVLAATGTPADLGIYVPISSYWKVHLGVRGSIFEPEALDAEMAAVPPDEADELGVTAALVNVRNISDAYRLYQELNASPDLQAALPGVVLTQFLSLLGQGQQALTLVTYVALVMALLSAALSLYGAVRAQQRDIAVMRALGASRSTALTIALWEALLQAALGVSLGVLLGHLAAAGLAGLIGQQSGLAVRTTFETAELPIALSIIGLGVVAGALPALQAYRVEAARTLAGLG